MFTDIRSKKIVFIAHCLLNQNAISDGTAVYPAAFCDLIDLFMQNNIGIVQLPCPELSCLGLDRGDPLGATRPVVEENTRIRNSMKQKNPALKLKELIDHVMQEILEYRKYNFQIIAIIGANRSPNCGVNTTSDHNLEIDGPGLFMKGLSDCLERAQIDVPMIGIKASDSLERIKKLISRS